MASSSQKSPPMGAANEKAPVEPSTEKKNKEKPPVPVLDPAAPSKGDNKKKKKTKRAIMPQSHIDYLESTSLDKDKPLPPLPVFDEKFMEDLKAVVPNAEQIMAERGFTLESYRELGNLDDDILKAGRELLAEIRQECETKGYAEMEVTDDEEETRAALGKGRRRFRPGVAKKGGGDVSKLN